MLIAYCLAIYYLFFYFMLPIILRFGCKCSLVRSIGGWCYYIICKKECSKIYPQIEKLFKNQTKQYFPKGFSLFEEGELVEDVIYIILRGEVAIKTYGKTILKLSCGDCIGEMEIFGHDRYMASAEVTKHSLLLCVKVDKSIFENPVCLRFLLGNLYSKNRRLDQSLVFILEKKSLW